MPQISLKGQQLPSSPIRKLTPFADAVKRRGVKVYHLNIGQPDLPTPKKALDALKAIDRTTLEYSPSQGLLSMRQGMQRYYKRFGIDLGLDEMIVTTGGSEALIYAFMATLNPGDEIIMTEPTYANYLSIAKFCGVNVRTVASSIETGFALPPKADYEAVITPQTKAILICNPNNPTGYVYTRDELFTLRDIVLKHNLFLIADEVYREFVYNDEPFLSTMCLPDLEDHVVLVDSMSKRYSECGIRVGCIASHNKELMACILKFAQMRLSPPLLGQIVAEASIDGTEEYAKACYEEYKARRDFFIEALNEIPGVYSPKPNGAFYTVASLPVDDTEDFCRWLLTDFVWNDGTVPGGETLMMAPAAGFYRSPSKGRNQVRLAYVLKIEDLKRALLVLRKALEAYARIPHDKK